MQWIGIVLILISFAYYIIGFKLSFIPYPTAWDANHAYMLMPNSISGAFGWTWDGPLGVWYMPVYLSFVSFFFSIIKWLGSKFWLSPDTFGVEMNYLTAIFTFICTLWIVDKILAMVTHKDSNHRSTIMSLGWFIKILWLTSGMWAFLVFVDNKTDFGIMYLSCMWLLTWLGYLDYIITKYNSDPKDNISSKEWINDLYISWIFFWLAVVSKVTALFDAMNFVLLVVWFLLWGIVLIWLWLIIAWALTYMGLNWVSNFISKPFANIAWFWWGTLFAIIWLGRWQQKHSYAYRPRLIHIVRQLAMRWVIFLLTIVVLKLPIWLYRYMEGQTTPSKMIKELIIGKTDNKTSKPMILLASNNLVQLKLAQQNETPNITSNESEPITTQDTKKGLDPRSCNLESLGVTDIKDLYKNLLTPPWDGYNEDVGRYVWFGQKEFNNPRRWFLIWNNACISLNKSACTLFKNRDSIAKLDKTWAWSLLAKFKPWSQWYTLISKITSWFNDPNQLPTFVADSQKSLNDFRQDKVITKNGNKVYIPYKAIVPLNVTFNRSLQNLSSYYTDIGIIWLMLQFFVIIAIIYGLIYKSRIVRAINLIALIGWLLWIAVWWWIVWYGIGLITRTIMWFIVFVHDLYVPADSKNSHGINHTLFYTFIGLFVIFWVIQLALNFVRIASQWWWGPFLQYKYSNGQELQIDENLQQKVDVKFPYRWTDILNLQFPHYKKVTDQINNQTGSEINLIAWTYAQYWINNQARLYGDWFLGALWKWFSDRDECKSYLRLKDQGMKYMIIDPNIASIIMWWWNSSLMDRFFAKIDPTNGKIVTDGTLSMISKLINKGYLKLYASNNLWARYGYGLPADYLKAKFNITNDDDLIILRARLATVRFRWNQDQLIQALAGIFTERVANGQAISDLADVFGKVIDEKKLSELVNKAQSWWFPSIANDIKTLDQDERFVLLNYLNLITTYNKQPAQFGSVATNLITQSLGGWSQVIVFEVP